MIKMTKKNEVKLSAQQLEKLGKRTLATERVASLIKCSTDLLAITVYNAMNSDDLAECQLALKSVYECLDTLSEPLQEMAIDLEKVSYPLLHATDSAELKECEWL